MTFQVLMYQDVRHKQFLNTVCIPPAKQCNPRPFPWHLQIMCHSDISIYHRRSGAFSQTALPWHSHNAPIPSSFIDHSSAGTCLSRLVASARRSAGTRHGPDASRGQCAPVILAHSCKWTLVVDSTPNVQRPISKQRLKMTLHMQQKMQPH